VTPFRAGAILSFTGPFPGITDHEQYASIVSTALAAEAEGFEDLWLGEHHYLERMNSAPITLAAYLLARTNHVRVGTAVSLLAAHNPVHIAEQAAVIDHLSGGRFDLGVGRGGPTAMWEVMASMEAWEAGIAEPLDLLMQSFTGSVAADSERFRFRNVSPQPRPFTQPHPPVLVAAGSESTVTLAARHGVPCQFFVDGAQGPARIKQLVQHHAAVAVEHGHEGPWEHAIVVYAQVGDTDEQAAAVIRGPLRNQFRAVDTGYIWLREQSELLSDNVQYLEDVIAHDAIGTPATCTDRLTQMVERTGVGRLILVVESSGTPDGSLTNVRRLGQEVLPEVRQRLQVAPAAVPA